MFSFIASKVIHSHDVNDPKVREQYGMLCSIVGIFANLVCVAFKVSMGLVVHSTAIIADGFNNATDAISNIASLLGFKLASRHPDAEHPYGHGRFEYLSGLFITMVILIVGLSALYESLLKIIKPNKVTFSFLGLVILLFTMGIKFWMYSFNHSTGKKINSQPLLAAAQDSLNDVMTTCGSVATLVLAPLTSLPVDGIIGLLVSIVVLKSGWDILSDTVDNLLGKKPDPEIVRKIREAMLSYPGIYGVHDMMIHDYGPGRRYLIAHLEVSAEDNILEAHNLIDGIEEDITKKFNIFTTIHMDPIELNDTFTNKLHVEVEGILHGIDEHLSMHDFRVVKGDHTKLIFDVLMCEGLHKHEVNEQLVKGIHDLDPSYECVIQYDYPLV